MQGDHFKTSMTRTVISLGTRSSYKWRSDYRAMRQPVRHGKRRDAVSPPIQGDCGVLLSNADAAMYEAKARGRSRSCVFDAPPAAQWSQRLELTNDLRDALSEESLDVHYQPIIDLQTGHVIAVEALARWHHLTRGWVPPAVFVPLAEDGGFVAILDKWVLAKACRDATSLRAWGALSETAASP